MTGTTAKVSGCSYPRAGNWSGVTPSWQHLSTGSWGSRTRYRWSPIPVGWWLARPGLDREAQPAFWRAWSASGLPRGFRHEFISVALIRRHRDALLWDLSDEERELVEYLVGIHHGRGRPFVPVAHDREA